MYQEKKFITIKEFKKKILINFVVEKVSFVTYTYNPKK